jgi:hypothetical protein
MSQPGTVAAAVADRPGLSFYTPGVRIARLEGDVGASDAGTLLPESVMGDLVRAQVTRVHSGPSQYSLTLNNWYLSTASDRSQHSDAFGSGSPREAIDGDKSQPFWPRFKYNDFAVFRFGTRLRVDMRYVPEPKGGASDEAGTSAPPTNGGWTPMVCGPITDISFSFDAAQGAQLTVSGEDDLSRLKDKLPKRVPMERRPEINIVQQALAQAKYKLPIARPLVKYPSFVTDEGQGLHEAIASGQSILDFLLKMAERLDFEVFLEFADLDVPSSPIEFHFEPYRGRARPDAQLRPTFRLDRGANLLEFTPAINVVNQYSKVEMKGRHRDPLLAKEVKGEATHSILSDELHIDPDRDGPLKSGPEVRAEYFKGRTNPLSITNQSNLDDVRADWAAKAVIRKKARELFTIDATTVGGPRLRPGRHVEIRGMRAPFDGFFYITKTVHTFGVDGYRTKIMASRPGMELAPYAQKQKKEGAA